jgi:hypothetical protein
VQTIDAEPSVGAQPDEAAEPVAAAAASPAASSGWGAALLSANKAAASAATAAVEAEIEKAKGVFVELGSTFLLAQIQFSGVAKLQ